ncbi:hypothetical protein ACIQZB_02095 [Streptomyces sp. NPDC097727]|uniref:hypothetical protein n=1 Tax=Streptomyces sp. NPDC097727 TaxID=3366092 RepID=UPI003814B832
MDCTQFELVLEKIRVPRPEPADPERRPAAWPPTRPTATDRATTARAATGTWHTILEKADSQAVRLREGSPAAGGPRPS